MNELASRFACDRVALGIDRGGRARLLALSHSAVFEKKSQFVAALENAMDEALDQRCSVAFPPVDADRRATAIAHRDFAANRSVCSVVLVSRGIGIGVLTFEQSQPFSADDVRGFEAVSALLGPLLESRIELHRWFAGRLVDQCRDGWRHLRTRGGQGFRVVLALVILRCCSGSSSSTETTASAPGRTSKARCNAPPSQCLTLSCAKRRYAPALSSVEGRFLATLDDRDLLARASALALRARGCMKAATVTRLPDTSGHRQRRAGARARGLLATGACRRETVAHGSSRRLTASPSRSTSANCSVRAGRARQAAV
ncbi:MAG: GAF domain-containing protein [Candidatus Accumulibacter sp.]|nr:GAF domain-containing protein [Candidatus Accumulibacter propinquus]